MTETNIQKIKIKIVDNCDRC